MEKRKAKRGRLTVSVDARRLGRRRTGVASPEHKKKKICTAVFGVPGDGRRLKRSELCGRDLGAFVSTQASPQALAGLLEALGGARGGGVEGDGWEVCVAQRLHGGRVESRERKKRPQGRGWKTRSVWPGGELALRSWSVTVTWITP